MAALTISAERLVRARQRARALRLLMTNDRKESAPGEDPDTGEDPERKKRLRQTPWSEMICCYFGPWRLRSDFITQGQEAFVPLDKKAKLPNLDDIPDRQHPLANNVPVDLNAAHGSEIFNGQAVCPDNKARML